jgi:hypothetical protein
MVTSEKKWEHLNDHLPYELLMLRYTYQQLHKQQLQLNWNVYLETLAVHARNLYYFLTSKAKNLKANDFDTEYKHKGHLTLTGTMQKLQSQVLHLGKERSSDPEKKTNTDHADRLYQWIEKEMSRFLASLSPEDRIHWRGDGADLDKVYNRLVEIHQCPMPTTSHPLVTVSSFHSPQLPVTK